MDCAQINQQLVQRIEDVARHLYPNGKIEGSDWVVGGVGGESGNSLKIKVRGPKAGMFLDFADQETKGGTPIWLWHKARNISVREAIKEAKTYLGLPEEYGLKNYQSKKTWAKPNKDGMKLIESTGSALNYLVEVRKIDPSVVSKFRVGETTDAKNIVFPYFDSSDPKEKSCHLKFLQVERGPNGEKKMWGSKDTKRCLYGKHTITSDTTTLVICEGEIDALSWHTYGIQAVSVPNGVKDMEWIELDWDWLQAFDKIYIALDTDEPGAEATKVIAKRLGMHRCYVVEMPKKDANQCLTEGVSPQHLENVLSESQLLEPEDLKLAREYTNKVWKRFNATDAELGIDTPWKNLPWRLRRGEYTVWSGYSGHGKTITLNQLIVHAIGSGWKVLDCSLEVKPDSTLKKMIPCAIAKPQPETKEELDAIVEWAGERLWFYDFVGTTNVEKLIQVCDYAIKRYGVSLIVIDSLFKCGISSEDYNGQRQFADKLTAFCADTGAHVILVAHSRKAENELKAPSKLDVSGSSDITNAAHNVVICWRNKMKQRMLRQAYEIGGVEGDKIKAEWINQPDAKLVLDKDREEGEETEAWLWFDRDTMQFRSKQDDESYPYFIYKPLPQ